MGVLMARPAVLTGAFWTDALERVGSTLVEALLAAMVVAGGFGLMGSWSFWEPVLWVGVMALGKSILAGLASPNTGASLGTAVPGALVSAYTSQTKQTTDAGTVLAHPGDTVAGPAAVLKDGRPVDVTAAGVSPYSAPMDEPDHDTGMEGL